MRGPLLAQLLPWKLDVYLRGCFLCAWTIWLASSGLSEEAPDIRTVAPDLEVPSLVEGAPAAGKRVRVPISEGVYYTLYLPPNFDASKRHPMIVEFAGNGGYQNQFGDVSEGVPEGSKLGYGISGGRDFVWLCLPFLTEDGNGIATQWWGSPPQFSPKSTVESTKRIVQSVVERYRVDPQAVLLAGFSRGAIACNFIGLHDDEISDLWCGMVVYSHYDGVRDWGLVGTGADEARQRLLRLKDRPQFICHESTPRGLGKTKNFLRSDSTEGKFTFQETGFRNHNDAWCLRPSPARDALRQWVETEVPAISTALARVRKR